MQVDGTAVVHCGFFSENGGFKISDRDKSYMQTCKVVVSTCAFGGGDDLYQPIGMSEISLKKVRISVSCRKLTFSLVQHFDFFIWILHFVHAGLLCCILG